MRSEGEVRRIKERYERELESLVDAKHRICNMVAIQTLEMVLDE